jgi:hypothetical protein
MEEAPKNGKELSHSARANGMNEYHFTRARKFNVPQVLHFLM